MMFPMMFSPILVGFQFKYLFNDNVGLVNNALFNRWALHRADPLAGRRHARATLAIIFAEVWMSTSVFAILLLAGLMAHAARPDRGGARSMAATPGRCSATSRCRS